MKLKLLLILIAAFAMVASAADATGTWKATVETPNGTMESTFVLKVDGAKLTGTVTGRMGESQVSEGKVDGDNISFSVVREFNGNEFRMNYKGKVSETEIKFTVEMPAMDRTFEMTAKKVS
jgi:hypothetical protein